MALVGRSYAPEFVSGDPLLLPLAHLTSDPSPAFTFGLQLVAAIALVLLPVQILDATINRLAELARAGLSANSGPNTVSVPPTVSLLPSLDDDVFVEEVSSSEPIVAWRVWVRLGDTLRGAVEDWSERVKEAECPTCVEVPGVNCTCGIYGFKVLPDGPPFDRDSLIRGRAEFSGIVIEHELGYRAQRARILELWAHDFKTAAALERRYGCLVHTPS